MFKRIYFEKSGEMQYLAHRDFLRFLERLFKISDVPILYSKGFHPRPKMSFGSPISIGEEAYYEPFDIELKEHISNDLLKEKLNLKVPKGFRIIDTFDIDGKTSIVSSFNACLYEIYFEKEEEKQIIIDLLNKDTLIEERIKDGIRKIRDLKINVVSYEEKDKLVTLILNNISPNALMRMGNLDQKYIRIKRLKYLNI